MAQRVLSISLGSEVVKVCEVSLAGKKKVQVYNAIDLMVPVGLCEDGVIQNVDALASVILNGLQGEGFSANKIVFTISSKRIANKEATIPFCKENKIADIVRINASEYFPIANIDDYVFNYSILERLQNDGVKNYRLSVIATPKDLITDYYALAAAMGMTVHSIDYAGNSILQLLKLQTVGTEVDVILQMGMENTVVNIMSGKTLVMQRNVPYGRSSILEAVKSTRNVPDAVADLILMQEDIRGMVETNNEVSEAVRALFSGINRIIEFFSNKYPDLPISNIYMLGDVMSVLGLVELFDSEWIERNVVMLNNLHGIEIKDRTRVNEQIAANYLANIGALLAPMNMSVASEKDSKKKRDGLPWWLLIFSGVVAAGMIGGVLFVYFDAKGEVEDMQRRLEQLGEVEDLENESIRYQAEADTINAWYETTKSPNESLTKFIEDLENYQPSDIAITHFSLNDGIFSLEGVSSNKPAIAEFIKEMKKLEYVSDVNVSIMSETIEDKHKSIQFNMTLQLQYTSVEEEENLDTESQSELGETVDITDEDFADIYEMSEDNSGDEIIVEDFADNDESEEGILGEESVEEEE